MPPHHRSPGGGAAAFRGLHCRCSSHGRPAALKCDSRRTTSRRSTKVPEGSRRSTKRSRRMTASGAREKLMRGRALFAFAAAAALAVPASAQSFPTSDATLRRIWEVGMQQSQVYPLMQVLLDSIGPRLTATPEHRAGNDWLVKTYAAWGVPAKVVDYGTWKGWRRGISHIDLVAPRVRSLEGMMLAWSPGTPNGRPVQGEVVILPDVADSAAFVRWLPNARGKFVMVNMAQPTCRPDENWQRWATEESYEAMRARRDTATRAWNARVQRHGLHAVARHGHARPPARAGRRRRRAAVALVAGLGRQQGLRQQEREHAPAIDLSCEDYGMVYRLAENATGTRAARDGRGGVHRRGAGVQHDRRDPRQREAQRVRRAVGALRLVGRLAGATDNGTGTIVMLEAMRILRQAYPNPKRTIISATGRVRSRGSSARGRSPRTIPRSCSGLQALFNQDNGTGRVVSLSSSGLTSAARRAMPLARAAARADHAATSRASPSRACPAAAAPTTRRSSATARRRSASAR